MYVVHMYVRGTRICTRRWNLSSTGERYYSICVYDSDTVSVVVEYVIGIYEVYKCTKYQ